MTLAALPPIAGRTPMRSPTTVDHSSRTGREKISPITFVKQAKTPTLIQHGELDHRVPIANGYELRQALEDRGVPVEMVVYKGFPHGIGKPKGQRAVMSHNLRWFNHYIFGDPLPDLTSVGVVQ